MLNGAFEMKQLNGNGRLPRGSARSGGQGERLPEGACAMIETAEFYPANMLSAARGGYINADALRGMIWFRRNCRSEMHIRLLVSW